MRSEKWPSQSWPIEPTDHPYSRLSRPCACAANRSASCHVKEQRCSIIIISTIRANHCPPPLQPCNCTAAIIVTIITVINSLVALVSLLSFFFPFLLLLVFYFLLGFGLCNCCCWLGLDAKLSYFQRAKPSQKKCRPSSPSPPTTSQKKSSPHTDIQLGC